MDTISPDRVQLSVAEAIELAESALAKLGYDAEEARIVADHVIDAALCGYEYSGLPKILNLAEHRRLREGIAIDRTIYDALLALPDGRSPAHY